MIHFLLLLFSFLYWRTVDLQCCVNYCCTAKWFSKHILGYLKSSLDFSVPSCISSTNQLRKCQTVSQSGCTLLQSQQPRVRVPVVCLLADTCYCWFCCSHLNTKWCLTVVWWYTFDLKKKKESHGIRIKSHQIWNLSKCTKSPSDLLQLTSCFVFSS